MKVELENILDIGTTLYSLDENFKIKRKVVVNIRSVFDRYSIEYKDSIVPLQESTDEDATTATYKKTYKFIGTW